MKEFNHHEATKASSSEVQIQNLMNRYCYMVDLGDYEGVAELLKYAKYIGPQGTLEGKDKIATFLKENSLTDIDGKTKTLHANSNIIIEVNEDANTARALCYCTVFQALDTQPLHVFATGKYIDAFERKNGEWYFIYREITNIKSSAPIFTAKT